MLLLYSIIFAYTYTNQSGLVKQGISGKVYLKQGNYMPSPGKKAGPGQAVSRTIWIYRLTAREQARASGSYFDHIQTKLVAKTQSDSEGNYAIALPPGKYSVFVDDNSLLYANSFDGKGNINPVEVKKDSISNKDITISSQAVY
ncbi:hypothetical protein Mucpa_4063 [Mucilaginibacter paludis DSM 18603]|uniref:Carboxypeptidase regulatory-like domain-containing protein n=2 Tax=Mucilaginibacter TaxID=423349 RepID=H1Y0A5_9SPHI|nr:hypothetical protein Mucpa_4063 [Mucilaginibacter paludis DSM 18603]